MSNPPIEAIDKASKTIWIGPCEGSEHVASCFVLHGFGDSSVGWYEIVLDMAKRLPTVRFIIPTAKENNMGINSWFDFERELPTTAIAKLEPLVDFERQKCSNIAIIGFSQGGSVSMAHLFGDVPMRAAVSMSGFFTRPSKTFMDNLTESHLSTPILVTHGTLDDVVKFKSGVNSVSKLTKCGFKNVTFKQYDLPHSVSPDVIHDVTEFLRKHLTEDVKSKL
eukprot:TRINITY_DN17123_c0_g1_i3.p1 TRINITY_DN17123_c0_g1~~TRINITY_DN17123_c0_g1_i3.p1  ORF type:complete len:243 (+),score=35.28 TRINITY_DN17123_c0_g1_i3:66-731(+)